MCILNNLSKTEKLLKVGMRNRLGQPSGSESAVYKFPTNCANTASFGDFQTFRKSTVLCTPKVPKNGGDSQVRKTSEIPPMTLYLK